MNRTRGNLLKSMRAITCGFIVVVTSVASHGSDFRIARGEIFKIEHKDDADPVIVSAIEMFRGDLEKVVGVAAESVQDGGDMIVGVSKDLRGRCRGIDAMLDSLDGKWEAFGIKVLDDGTLLVAGSDSHGAAYGVLELSRHLGVSPWEWWADSEPETRQEFALPSDYTEYHSPSVAYRGIFINDEDWG